MIQSSTLLKDLQAEVAKLEDDLRARCDAEPAVNAPLQTQYEAARAQKRTALTFNAWREEELTNVAVAWVLACVFVRFLEDNSLIETLYLAGPDREGVTRARDQHELFFRQHPKLTEREYLEHVFQVMEGLPGMKEFFDRRHNPLWSVGPSGDAAAAFMNFWRKTNPETGRPVHEFSDPSWATRFLGDLYQDLSEAARKRYALLQTPVFVEEFILDRTLSPAIETFGFRVVRMIDPTCGSGHFLLGGFARLHQLWLQADPAEAPAVLAQRALDQVFGVDLNPNVVAIARFRLLIAALQATGTTRLRDAFNFRINVTTGDALLHGRRFGLSASQGATQRTFDTEEDFRDELKHHYEIEDAAALHRILGQQYHAVVGNPPYITVKDRAVSELYRDRYPCCHRGYSLAIPFFERFWDLAVPGDAVERRPAGYIGMITTNSFMKRDSGKKLVEGFFPKWDITHIIDTDKAHLLGHATGTIVILGKNQLPVAPVVRTLFGIKKQEPAPKDPSRGLVWQSILQHVDYPDTGNEWVTCIDSPRRSIHTHPCAIGIGGVVDVKESLDAAAELVLKDLAKSIGFFQDTHSDEAFVQPIDFFPRLAIANSARLHVRGTGIRNWEAHPGESILFPYDADLKQWFSVPAISKWSWFWALRTTLWSRTTFGGGKYREEGRPWFDYHQFPKTRAKSPLLIAFAFLATHNHFVVVRRGMVFNRHAPVISLSNTATETQHLTLVGLLNSSTACFWLKQVSQDKGAGGIGGGISAEMWEHRFEFDGSKLKKFPIPSRQPVQIPTALDKTSAALRNQSPAAVLESWEGSDSDALRTRLANARTESTRIGQQLIALQEELDWQIYEAFGIVEGISLQEGEALDAITPTGIQLGERAFEIVLARLIEAGEMQTTWFQRHGSTPITELPRHWTAAYRELVERRIARIESDPNIRLIEQPEYKRRWNTEPWDEQFQRAARDWLLGRLEGYFHEGQRVCELKDGFDPSASGFVAAKQPALTTTSQLAGTAQTDAAFLAVAEQLMGGPGYSVPKLVRELVEGAAVPFLPTQRYKPSGLLKRADWEHVWDLQRNEDAIEAEVRKQTSEASPEAKLQQLIRAAQKEKLGEIPVPPKYGSGDFKRSVWWSLRGKLDVPKERWISYPGAERTEDPSPVIAWAGWDHAQQARALAEYYLEAKQNYGFPPEKLKPLLAGLADLSPWLQQWHSAIDPAIGDSPARAIQAFVEAECHALGTTPEDLERVRMGA